MAKIFDFKGMWDVVVNFGEMHFNNPSSRYWMSMPYQPNASKESRLLNTNKKRSVGCV